MPCNRTHLCVCFVTRHLFFFPHRVPTVWHCHHKKKSCYLSTGEMKNIPSKACGGCMPTGCGQKKQYASLSTAEDDVAHGRGQQTRRDVVLKIARPSIGMPIPRTVQWQHVHTLRDRECPFPFMRYTKQNCTPKACRYLWSAEVVNWRNFPLLTNARVRGPKMHGKCALILDNVKVDKDLAQDSHRAVYLFLGMRSHECYTHQGVLG